MTVAGAEWSMNDWRALRRHCRDVHPEISGQRNERSKVTGYST
jgi:hypothetical protein